ncbi:hypothetical protein [Roseomonas marmotae]|uniref:Glycosyltransferase RgtA/B/C/D-like domain-containing protein n=1 Tax=Roseomonas marmotae TaxID=2768161 RepID=A0ABS3K7T6_9PROT|nr:hypothetical protein [Roseomonas marmotae]MBO1073067.1 hypothetical protein [Roseomonas marmotae]QTI79289.1 hypothetical protein IAI58_00140 [Roseomonas marmotae]
MPSDRPLFSQSPRFDAWGLVNAAIARPEWTGAALLVVLYAWSYFSLPPLPGNDAAHALGWLGWFDQSRHLESARALAQGDLSPARHWYPLGYALLTAPFALWSPGHSFVVVNLASLLLCYAGFLAFSARAGVAPGWAALVFLFSLLVPGPFLGQWTIPWNTSPTSALIWLLLAQVAAHLQGARRPLPIGLLAAAIPLIRPTEALVAALCVLAAILSDLRHRPRHPLRDLGLLLLGGLLPVVAYAALHLRIYGFQPSPYMLASREMGFSFHALGLKAYTLLLDPAPWFQDGRGLLQRAPYLALALAGGVVAWAHSRLLGLLALLIAVHTGLYLAYTDLLPTGFWRFLNYHYFKWAIPGATLLGFVLLRDLLRWRRAPAFPLAPLALLLSLPLLSLHLLPERQAEDAPARMIFFPGTPQDWSEVYFGRFALRDAEGEMHNFREMRVMPVPGGFRVFALRRPFQGPVQWVAPPAGLQAGAAPEYYGALPGLGRPCWLRLRGCPRLDNPLLPPAPRY